MNAVALAEPATMNKRSGLPWKPMARVTWLQHRFMLLGTLGLFGCVAAYILFVGPPLHALYSQYISQGCPTPNSANVGACVGFESQIQHSAITMTFIDIALHVLPVVLGVFVGAPLIAREFESGTYRFTWTQGMPRTVWFALKFTLLAVVVVAGTCVLGLFASSYSGPFNALGLLSRWQSGEFDVTVLTLAAWTLFGLALGAFLGSLIKRTVSAMAVTGAVIGGLLIATFWKLDYFLLGIGTKTMKTTPSGSGFGALNIAAGTLGSGPYGAKVYHEPIGSWVVNGWYTGAKGAVLDSVQVRKLVDKMYSANLSKSPAVWLAQHHDAYWVSYQPANRFWMFQSVEAVILVGLTLVLAWGTASLIRRRA